MNCIVIVIAIALSIALVACGGSSNGPSSGPTGTVVTAKEARCDAARGLVNRSIVDVSRWLHAFGVAVSTDRPCGERKTADGLWIIGVRGTTTGGSNGYPAEWACTVRYDPATERIHVGPGDCLLDR